MSHKYQMCIIQSSNQCTRLMALPAKLPFFPPAMTPGRAAPGTDRLERTSNAAASKVFLLDIYVLCTYGVLMHHLESRQAGKYPLLIATRIYAHQPMSNRLAHLHAPRALFLHLEIPSRAPALRTNERSRSAYKRPVTVTVTVMSSHISPHKTQSNPVPPLPVS